MILAAAPEPDAAAAEHTHLVSIVLPRSKSLPTTMAQFTPDENWVVIELGVEALLQARRRLTGLSSEQTKKLLEDGLADVRRQAEQQLARERAEHARVVEEVRRIYEAQVGQWQKKCEHVTHQVRELEQGNRLSLQEEVQKVQDKYESLFREKDKQVERVTQSFDRWVVHHQQHSLQKASSSAKGSVGERQFEELAQQTFVDFPGFQLLDKHTQGGEGDFHLHFQDFNVLVDAKNYTKKVPVEQRDKIKQDLLRNEHISFAWLVSLNTAVDKFDRAPIMFEWINSRQCVVYCNHLLSFQDPTKLLRIMWFTCRELFRFALEQCDSRAGGEENEEDEEDDDMDGDGRRRKRRAAAAAAAAEQREMMLQQWKDRHFHTMDKIKTMRQTIREINTSLNKTKNLVQTMDDQLRQLLEQETRELVESHASVFDQWWNARVRITPDGMGPDGTAGDEPSWMSSTDLWFAFRQEHRDICREMDVTVDKFRQFLKAKVPLTHLLLKSKQANSAFDVKGVQLIHPSSSNTANHTSVAEEPVAKRARTHPDNNKDNKRDRDNNRDQDRDKDNETTAKPAPRKKTKQQTLLHLSPQQHTAPMQLTLVTPPPPTPPSSTSSTSSTSTRVS